MVTAAATWETLVEAGIRLSRSGLIAGSEGNISVRLDDGSIMITPSGLRKGSLGSNDAVLVDSAGQVEPGQRRPSSDLAMHLFLYRRRPDVRACVHSHAPHATSFALAGSGLPDDLLAEMAVTTGSVPLVPYATQGTQAVAQALEPFVENHDAFLLSNHGLVTIGRNLDEAMMRHEIVEHCARITHLARQLGKVRPIAKGEMAKLRKMREGSR